MDIVIFDLDGTLLDSKKTILRCLNTTLAEQGFGTFADEDLYSLIGMDLMEILALKGANRQEIAARYTEIQLESYMDDMKVYSGVFELLEKLKNAEYKIAAITMRRGTIAREVLSGFGLVKYFDEVIGADEVSAPKPSGNHALAVCERLSVSPDSCIVVGDSKYDMLSGKSAGCTVIGVTWGMGGVEELQRAGADHIVDGFDGLTELLLRLK